jgi:hypothetical protein
MVSKPTGLYTWRRIRLNMRRYTRPLHVKEIFGTWWTLLVGVWGLISFADAIVGHYASASFKTRWDALWLPKWGWRDALIGFAFFTIVFVFESSFRVVRKTIGESEQQILGEQEVYNEKSEGLKRQLDAALASTPIITSEFSNVRQQAVVAVTNSGPSAKVWASLSVRGMVRPGIGPYARWSHSSSYKVVIAKGETQHLQLAVLLIRTSSFPTSTWQIHSATEESVAATEAYESSLLQTDEAQASPIDLYVRIFSDPACPELPAEWHIVLHYNRAELGD